MVREAVGSAHPSSDDLVRDTEAAVVRLVEMQIKIGGSSGGDRAVVAGLCREHEENRRHGDWWQTEVEQRLADSGLTPSEVMAVSDFEIAQRIAPLLDDAILAIYHGHQEHAWTRSIINGIEALLAEVGVYSRLKRPPAICFLDLTGYTRLIEEHGDSRAAELADELARIVRPTSGAHQGTPVKWLGDGVMFHLAEPGQAVEVALTMVDELNQIGLPPGHVGIHAGPVLYQAGDYYGKTVNLAARISDYARPGEVLVSEPVVEQSEGVNATFSDLGQVEMKGVSGIVHLYSALPEQWKDWL